MRRQRLNSYRLSVHCSSYYVERFDESNLRTFDFGSESPRSAHNGFYHCVDDDPIFEVRFPLTGDEERRRNIEFAKVVLRRIVELDDWCRHEESEPGEVEFDEQLSIVHVHNNEVALHYSATFTDFGWKVEFRYQDGLFCLAYE